MVARGWIHELYCEYSSRWAAWVAKYFLQQLTRATWSEPEPWAQHEPLRSGHREEGVQNIRLINGSGTQDYT